MTDLEVKTEVQNKDGALKKFKILKIITSILYVIATAFSLWLLIDIVTTPQNIGTAFALIAWFAIAIPTLAVPMVVALVGLIISAVNKKRSQCDLGSLIYFIVFTALPIATFFICILIFNLCFN